MGLRIGKLGWGVILAVGLVACRPVATLPAPVPTTPAPAVRQLRLFWVNSYSVDDLWSQQIQTGLREGLALRGYVADMQATSRGTLELEAFHMDLLHQPGRMEQLAVAQQAVAAIQAFDPDLVVISDDEAAEMVIPLYPDPSLPFVFTGISGDPHDAPLAQPNATGVLERPYGVQTVHLAKTFVPHARRMMILSDGSPSGWAVALAVYNQVTEAKLLPEPPLLRVTNQWDVWQQAILTETAEVDFVLLGRYDYLTNYQREEISRTEIFRWTWNNSSVPIFGLWEGTVQDGAVAGLTISAYEQGREAAEVVVKIWNGTYPSDIRAHSPARNVLAVNSIAAQHWNLPFGVEFPITARIYKSRPEGGQ